MRKHKFTLLCWAVMALGLFLACSKKPAAPLEPVGSAKVPGMPKTKLAEAVNLEDIDVPPTATVLFDLNSSQVKDPEQVGAIAKVMTTMGNLSAVVAGHACPLGPEFYNEYLGLRRAQAVAMHMEAYGVPSWRVKVESMGEWKPLARDSRDYWKNRRVEVEFLREVH